MDLGKQKAFIIHVVYFAIILFIIKIGIQDLLPILMPFVIGLIVAALLRRTIDYITLKTKIKRPFVSIILLLVFYSAIVILLILIGTEIFDYLRDNVIKLPKLYMDTIEPALNQALDNLMLNFPELEFYLEDIFESISNSIITFLTNASSTILGLVTGFASQIPSILIKLIFTIVASFFFTIDFHNINNFVLKQFSDEKKVIILKIKDNIIGTIGKFIKAYTTLITITFIELSIGLLILRVPNSFVIAALIAVIDLLPVLGTGAVLIPWFVIAFVIGNNVMGIGILVLYIVITVVRQSLEPRIVGQQIGLHPIVTLLCIFVGAQFFGVVGLLLLPVTATILKKLNDEGSIRLFK